MYTHMLDHVDVPPDVPRIYMRTCPCPCSCRCRCSLLHSRSRSHLSKVVSDAWLAAASLASMLARCALRRCNGRPARTGHASRPHALSLGLKPTAAACAAKWLTPGATRFRPEGNAPPPYQYTGGSLVGGLPGERLESTRGLASP